MASAQSRCSCGAGHSDVAQMDNKWQFGQLLENVQSRQFFSPKGESKVIQVPFDKDSVFSRCLQNRIVPLPRSSLPWRNPLFDPPFQISPVHSRPPLPPFVRQSQSPKKIAKIFLRRRSLVPPPQSISLSCCGLAARRRGLQGSLNLLRPPLPAAARPTVPSSTARRYHTRSEWSNIGRGRPCSRLVVTLGSQYWARGKEEQGEGEQGQGTLRLGRGLIESIWPLGRCRR